jgi:3-deoxy-D-manno-octulosonic-acid transferase
MSVLYSTALGFLVWTIFVPLELCRIVGRRASWTTLTQRLGRGPLPPPADSPRVVVHAVSVGEMAAAEALLPALGRELPRASFVLTTGNRDGMVAAQKLVRERQEVSSALLLPWDRARPLRRWLARLKPVLFVVVETEIWPNLYGACSELGVPLCIANGRVYPADVRRYRLARRFFRRVLSSVVWLGAQSEADRQRFREIGAPPDRIDVIGDLKYDAIVRPASSRQAERLTGSGPVLLAASTHHPEENLVLDAFERLRARVPGLRCVIAPRHTSRAASICAAARSRGLRSVRFSELQPADVDLSVVVVDEMGRLRDLFPRADLVIMGGSFAPRGGHNLLEPAAAGCAVVIGPHVEHFRAIVDDFRKRDAIKMVANPAELRAELARLLEDPEARKALGERGRQAWLAGRGHAAVYARHLAGLAAARRAAGG